jgi:VCBS repeat-containing protein
MESVLNARRHSRSWSPQAQGWALAAAIVVGLSAGSPFPAACSTDAGSGDLIAANEPVIFSVTGDIPYGTSEIADFQSQIDEHDLYSPSEFLCHVGDIKSGSEPCNSDRYQIVAGILKSSQVPCYIVPGDNETTDCSSPTQGMQYWNQYLLGIESNWPCSPATERQSSRRENFAFVHKGMLFLGINLVGGSNSTSLMQDDANWVTQQLQAKGSQVRGAVVFAQAGPGSNHSTFFNPFEAAAKTFAKPILYIHGDGHSWLLDHPFSAANVTRVQVEAGGSELPVQVTATLDSQNLFQFKRNPWSSSSKPVTRAPCGAVTPMLAISDQTVTEGNSGTVNAVFTVTLASANGQTVTVQYATSNGTATAGSDYAATSGSLSFSGTTTSRTVTVPVTGDLAVEPDETFFVDLSSPTNAGLADGRGEGTIRDDDGTNKAPLARSDDYSTNEDVVLSVPAPGVLANDSDPDGNPLTVSLQSGTSHGTLSLSSNGGFVYTPEADFSGSDEFTYIASDGLGGTATAAVTLGVNPVNDAPRAVADTWVTPVSTTLMVPVPGVLGNDTDADGDAITAELVSWPSFGSLTLAANGSFTYTPPQGFDGVDSFSYRVRDAVSVGTTATVSIGVGGPVSVTYNPAADAYVSQFKSGNNFGSQSELHVRTGNKAERSYLRFQVSGFRVVRSAKLRLWVVAGSSNSGSIYAVSNTYAGTTTPWTESGITWSNGPAIPATALRALGSTASGQWFEIDLTSAVPGDGTYCFALSGGATSESRFTSREGSNKPQLVIERGNTNGVPGNRPPVAGSDSYTATEDVLLSIAAPGVLGNDSDPDADALTATPATAPVHGTLSLQTNGGFSYTPAANYNGSDGFTYTVSDGRGGTATGSVALSVTAVNDAPVSAADAYSVARDGVLSVVAPGVLGNDSDVEGSPLTAALAASPTHGSVSLATNGSFTYTPAGGYTGSDSFTYRASDGSAQGAVTTVSFSVGAASGPVTFVEAKNGGSSGIASISTAAALGAAPGDVYLAAIATKSLRSVTGVNGLGLSWSRVIAQCSGRSQTGVEIWCGRGTPTSGVVTATLASAAENAVIAVARYSGADATNPLGNFVSGNSNGIGGACANGVDSAAFGFSLTTQGGAVFGGVAMRNHTVTPGAGWQQRADVRQGTTGSTASVTVLDRAAPAGTTDFTGTLDATTDWAAAAVEIRSGGAAKPIAGAGDESTDSSGAPLERVFPNPVTRSASIAYELKTTAPVELVVYNARGQRVRALHSGSQPAGLHLLRWDTRDTSGVPVPAGIYFVRVQLGERTVKQKIVVQR